MNVRNFEIHDVVVVNKKFGPTTTKTFKFEVSNIHNLLIKRTHQMNFRWSGTKYYAGMFSVLVCKAY
jgi:hypothetical protein